MLQYRSHITLADLRTILSPPPSSSVARAPKPTAPPHAVYRIPRGGLFEWVSSPHYLCEILIYGALCVVGGPCLGAGAWWMAAFVVLNLTHTAVYTQRWYVQTFPGYPKRRKAIFPFVL